MSPYTLFPSFSFLERVYKDGFRIILYSVKDYKKNFDKFFTHRLFPYEAIYEENSYVKIRTTQNPSNYVLYYDTKFLEDESYVLRRNETLINNNALVKCRVYDFNIDDLKLELLKVNNFDVKQIQGTIDDLWIGVFFDRNDNHIRYDLCKKAPNGQIVRAPIGINTPMDDIKYMHEKEVDKFAVQLNYVDAFECYKRSTDNHKYMDLMKGLQHLPIRRLSSESKDIDWICDDKTALAKIVKYGLPIEFAYKAANTENMVFIVEDIYRSCRDGAVYGPIYKTYMD